MRVHRSRSSQSDDRRLAVQVKRVSRSFPRRGCPHALQEPFVRLRRGIQTRQELTIGGRAYGKQGAIQQRVLGCTPGSVEYEIRAVFTGELRGPVNQLAYLWLNAKVQRVALAGLTLCDRHIV